VTTLRYIVDTTAPNAAKTFDGITARLTRLDADLRKAREIGVSDKQAAAALIRTQLRADRLRESLDMDLSVRGTAAAEAKLLTLEHTAKRVQGNLAGGGGRLRGLLGGLGTAAGAGGLLAAGSGGLALAGPLGAATAAIGAFGVVAIPVITKVTTAQKALNAAQQAYAHATTRAQRLAALKAEQKATEGLTASERGLMGPLAQIEKAWGRMESQLAPVVVNVLKVGIALGKSLLPAFKALAQVGGNALETVLGYLGQLTRSQFFRRFIRDVSQLANQAAPMLGQALVSLLRVFMKLFIQLGPPGLKLLGALAPAIVQIVKALTPMIVGVAQLTALIVTWLAKNHLLIPALAALGVALALALDTNPVGAMILAISALVAGITYLVKHWRQIWREILSATSGARHQIAVIFDGIRHETAAIWDKIFSNTVGTVIRLGHNIETQFNSLRHGIATTFDTIRHGIATAWDTIWRNTVGRVQRGIGDVMGFVSKLPGKIKAVFTGAGTWLLQAGKNVIQGLLNGLTAIWHKVTSFISGIAGWIKAHKGPIALDAKLLEPAGRALMSGLHTGLTGGFGLIKDFIGGIGRFLGGGLGGAGLRGLENLWISAGGPGGIIAHIAAAIALAESGGNPRARNPSGASGIWQILGQVVPGNIFDPFINALNAVKKYRDAGGFSPWVTFTSGAYRQFMGHGGIITEPIWGVGRSGRLYGFGERGPETVTPGITGGWGGRPAVRQGPLFVIEHADIRDPVDLQLLAQKTNFAVVAASLGS
jgi:phage-related protein